jgi:hypothetical protein
MSNFDLKKYLIENKITANSIIKEDVNSLSKEQMELMKGIYNLVKNSSVTYEDVITVLENMIDVYNDN